jgi:hypothetical protein
MATLEPTVAIHTCEDALRQLMGHVYANQYGAKWLERISSEEQRATWAERTEQEKRNGKIPAPYRYQPKGLRTAIFKTY